MFVCRYFLAFFFFCSYTRLLLLYIFNSFSVFRLYPLFLAPYNYLPVNPRRHIIRRHVFPVFLISIIIIYLSAKKNYRRFAQNCKNHTQKRVFNMARDNNTFFFFTYFQRRLRDGLKKNKILLYYFKFYQKKIIITWLLK